MTYFPYTVTDGNITILIDGSLNKIPRTHVGFAALSEHLKSNKHDAELILQLLDKRSALARLSSGKVKVVGNTVFYNGEPMHSTLANKMVRMLDEGYDGTPLAKFLDNVMKNPSKRSRECLFDFISKFDAPITEEGHFVAFKGVRKDYTDCYSGRFNNSPGEVVKQDRDRCVEDPSITCAEGLHVCASHYLDSFWTNKRVIAVQVNPRDVVSVPYDYNYSKMRVCEYLVLGDIEDERHRDRIENAIMVQSDPAQNRVDAVQPTAPKGYIPPEGWEMVYRAPDEGDYVLKPGSPDIGMVIEYSELDLDDFDHPDNLDWSHGDIAKNDAGCYYIFYVNFGDGVESFVVEDGYEVDLCVVVETEDDEEDGAYCDICGDEVDLDIEICDICEAQDLEDEMDEEDAGNDDSEEPLAYFHKKTGQAFTATQVVQIVDNIGQRGFHREYEIPRTTVQEWLKDIRKQ